MKKEKINCIARFRKEAGFTQKTLAEALNITDKAVSKWERGLSMPDVALLPKLSLLLGVDLPLLLNETEKEYHTGRLGLIDLRNYMVDLRQMIYDKPLVYYLLSYFLLSDVLDICVLCSKENRNYLQSEQYSELGFRFVFDLESCGGHDLMILDRPCFLFGSDLTRQIQGAMVSNVLIKLVPDNISAPILFCPAENFADYREKKNHLYENATCRTLGRGMVCIDMVDMDRCMDVSNFVRMYQKNCGLLIGSLEEIAYRKGLITEEKLEVISTNTLDRQYLKKLHNKGK